MFPTCLLGQLIHRFQGEKTGWKHVLPFRCGKQQNNGQTKYYEISLELLP
jgi:hypothetical protein